MKIGKLDFSLVDESMSLVAEPVRSALSQIESKDIFVTQIDPTLSDTATFCEAYEVGADISVNCVIVEAKRAERVWYAACLIVATDRIDVNGVVRRFLDAKKVSFAPMDTATTLSEMEYGAITPIGLPESWNILIDEKVAQLPQAIIGSGKRASKLLVSGEVFAGLPNAHIFSIAKSEA